MYKLWVFLAERDYTIGQLFLYAAVGCLIGYTLASITNLTALLEDVYILAHEQQRLSAAAARRAYVASQMAPATSINHSENAEIPPHA